MVRRRDPERMCSVCRLKAEQSSFVRIALGAEGEARGRLLIDARQRSSGRGAYLCRRTECWTADNTIRSLERALRATLGPPEITQIQEFARAVASEAATAR